MINIKNLSFGYNKKKLLYKDLNLVFESGNIYGLLGRNGAGKSTLLKNIIGLLFPTTGTISVNGYTPYKRLPSFLETIYFIPEEVYVPALSVNRYIDLFSKFYSGFNSEQFFEYLQRLDVTTEKKLNTLSFGQQKKFIIAFALACNTKVLLLDEPTSSVDPKTEAMIYQKMFTAFENKAIISSMHRLHLLYQFDYIYVLKQGRIEAEGTFEYLREHSPVFQELWKHQKDMVK